MKKVYLGLIPIILLFILSTIAYAGSVISSTSSILLNTNCDQAQFYSLGVICQDTDDGKLYKGTGVAIVELAAGASGDVAGPSASTAGELPLFDGTSGKLLKRSNTLTGIALLTSGVVGVAVAGTDYVAPDADITSIAGGVTGIVKGAGNGNGYSAAVAGTDYVAVDADITSIAGGVTGIVKGAGNGNGFSAATDGTDYLSPTYIVDTVYGSGWNADTTHSPSKNAVYDQMELRAPKTAGATDLLDMALASYSKPCVHLADCSGVIGIGRCCIDTDNGNMCVGNGSNCVFDATAINSGVLNINRLTGLSAGKHWIGSEAGRPEESDSASCSIVTLPNSVDPDISVLGSISFDTDGANEAGDASVRGFDGTNQFMVARKLHCIHATIYKPQDLADAQRDLFPIWSNETGMTFTITKIEAWSDTDDTDITLKEYSSTDFTSATTVDAVAIATNGTGVYYQTETTITHATIEANNVLTIDFDDTDNPGYVKVSICGWYNANVD